MRQVKNVAAALANTAWNYRRALAIAMLLSSIAYAADAATPNAAQIEAALNVCRDLGFSPKESYDPAAIQRVWIEYPGTEKLRDAVTCMAQFHQLSFALLVQVIATVNPDAAMIVANQLQKLGIMSTHGTQGPALHEFSAPSSTGHAVRLLPIGMKAYAAGDHDLTVLEKFNNNQRACEM